MVGIVRRRSLIAIASSAGGRTQTLKAAALSGLTVRHHSLINARNHRVVVVAAAPSVAAAAAAVAVVVVVVAVVAVAVATTTATTAARLRP